ncbi:NAD(P)/FAD-dependent oxidoreductase [Jidongwangia harbinensis]|uniref:NAD(P)/FAD-dependent oxidoreductase n=1 Tax=Jidongwangia harbinensis TaxID=2878561 RepID=UPI001CD9783C|nr:FAD-dependent monooxygenase [Jidongwangia harbinensis]MCA2218265.1 FAD-dependent monooxygenase [Jidongwangia harbinensis]
MAGGFDAIVVGARCAGAATAMLLARAGYRVLMLERARFPRDTLSTLYIHQPGIALLHRWGVLDAVTATGCPPIERVVHQVDGVRLAGSVPPVDGIRAAYAPRRYLLDQILADAAVAAGVDFRPGCTVEDVTFTDGRATGVRWRHGGRTVPERAPLIVGADGMRSRTAAATGAVLLAAHPLLTCVYYTFVAGVDAGFEAYGTTGRWAGSVPTNDGLTLVATYFPQSEFPAIRADAHRAHHDCLRTVAPGLYERIAAGTPADRLYGSGDQRNYLRQAAGPGWALVGDAGHHKDSITARGITDAFHQAQALADAVGTDLHDPTRLDAALAGYAARRDDLVRDGYRDALATAALRPRRRLRLLRAVAADPALTERFLATMAGIRPSGDLATPDLTAAVRH